jgi:hypothetical protein
MNTLAALVKSAAETKDDHTGLLALADALDEAHPHSQDGRALALRKRVAVPNARMTAEDWLAATGFDAHRQHEHIGHTDDGTKVELHTEMDWIPQNTEGDVLVAVRPRTTAPKEYANIYKQSRFLRATHAEARDIADGLPDPAAAHKYLDQYHGPDPRPKSPEHFARSLSSALRKLK